MDLKPSTNERIFTWGGGGRWFSNPKKNLGMFYMVKKAFICTPINKEKVFTNTIMTKLTSNGKKFFF
jgi:hypothetical protein